MEEHRRGASGRARTGSPHRTAVACSSGDAGVSEPEGVDPLTGADQLPDRVTDLPDVHVHRRENSSVAHPEGDELAGRNVAADHDPDVADLGIDVPGVLHAELVLVGEEVGKTLVGGSLAEHGLRGHDRLVERGGPVFDAQLPAQQRMVGVGDVADGQDVVIRRDQVPVHEDAVVAVQAARTRQPVVRAHPDADDDGVGLDHGAVGEPHGAHPHRVGGRGLDRRDGDPTPQRDGVLAMQVGEDLRHPGAEDPQQGQLGLLEHGDLGTARTGCRGGLQADPARADDDDLCAVAEFGPEVVAVVEAPETAHATEIGARHRQPPW